MGHEEAIKAIRAQGGTDNDVEAYLRSVGAVEVKAGPPQRVLDARAKARQATNEAERTNRSKLDDIGAIAQTFSDASTFGVGGIVDDALASMEPTERFGNSGLPLLRRKPGAFTAARDARKASRESLSGYDRTLATVGGAVANPVGTVFRGARAGAGIIKTGLLGAREGAVQGALTGFGENVGTTEGAKDATLSGAVYGGLFGGAIPASFRLGEKAKHIAKIFNAPTLGKVSDDLYGTMNVVDDVLYGEVRKEAGRTGTSPAIKETLESQTIKPFADLIRRKEATSGLNDAETLIEAYKQMSRAQRKTGKPMEASVEHMAEKELDIASISKAKGRMLDAAERIDEVDIPGEVPMSLLHPAGAPGLRTAVREHAEQASRINSFEEMADAIEGVLYDKSVKGSKLQLKSPEALAKRIKQMSPEQAEVALKAVYGRSRETIRLAPNPLSGYGVRPAIYHAVRAPGQIAPFVRLLEEQALLRSPFPTIGEQTRTLIPGLLGRTAGASR